MSKFTRLFVFLSFALVCVSSCGTPDKSEPPTEIAPSGEADSATNTWFETNLEDAIPTAKRIVLEANEAHRAGERQREIDLIDKAIATLYIYNVYNATRESVEMLIFLAAYAQDRLMPSVASKTFEKAQKLREFLRADEKSSLPSQMPSGAEGGRMVEEFTAKIAEEAQADTIQKKSSSVSTTLTETGNSSESITAKEAEPSAPAATPADEAGARLTADLKSAAQDIERGDLIGAAATLALSLENTKKRLPASDPRLLDAQLTTAKLQLALDHLDEARRRLEEVLAELEALGLQEDEVSVPVRALLADTLKAQGDWEGACDIEESIFAYRSDRLAENDPVRLEAGETLVNSLYAMGETERARELEKSLLRSYPTDDLINSPSDRERQLRLAELALESGDNPEALELYRGLLEPSRQADALSDTQRLRARRGFADALKATGDLDSALEQRRQILREVEVRAGAEDPLALNARREFAEELLALDKLEEARMQLQRVLDAQSDTLPTDHPDTQRTRRALAAVYRKQGDIEEARAMQQIVCASMAKTLPRDHPERLQAQLDLVALHAELGDEDAALAELDRFLVADSLEAEALESIDAMSERARELSRACQFEESLDERRRVLEVCQSELPEHHRATFEAALELAALLRVMGRTDEADEQERQNFEARPHVMAENSTRLGRGVEAANKAITTDGFAPEVFIKGPTLERPDSREFLVEVYDCAGVEIPQVRLNAKWIEGDSQALRWTKDQDGTRGRLELTVQRPKSGDSTNILITAKNSRGVMGTGQLTEYWN